MDKATPDISIIHPSRGRAAMAFETVKLWAASASNPEKIQYILSIDNDEPQSYLYQDWYSKTSRIFGLTCKVISGNKNVVQAANTGALLAKGGVFVLISDDFSCPDNWDMFILENINPEKEEALQINDGAWPEKSHILTLPILTSKLYSKLNYIYNPIFEGWAADTELAEHCNAMGVLKKNYSKPFNHKHWRLGKRIKDESDNRHDTPEKALTGNNILTARRKSNFGI